MLIGDRKISDKEKPLFIAEIGINHNGSLSEAKKLVDSCRRAGVEVVKHQTHIPDQEMSAKEAKKVIPGNSERNIYEIISDCSLNEEEEYELMRYVQDSGMIFISSPFSLAAIDRLESFNVPAYKIGSGEMNNFQMLSKLAKIGKPIIMSTGMHNLKSVQKSIDFLYSINPTQEIALLHTTNLYPTPDELVRLGALGELKASFDLNVGLSDHTITNYSSYGAIALGANIIEKHYTDTNERNGPDVVCSVTEADCIELLKGIEIIAKQRFGAKTSILEEQVTRDFAFATATLQRDIIRGHTITMEDVILKRPNSGSYNSDNLKDLIGKKCVHNLKAGHQILFKDIESS